MVVVWAKSLFSLDDKLYDDYNKFEDIDTKTELNAHYNSSNKLINWFRKVFDSINFFKGLIIIGFGFVVLYWLFLHRKTGFINVLRDNSSWIYKK